MQGYIKLHREITEHWIWDDARYLKWWLSILLNVNHRSQIIPVGSELFDCKPGQSIRSIETWTGMFGCSKKTTIKYFETLKKQDMISCKTIGKGNRRKHLLTVTNWTIYQEKETENSPPRKPECPP